MLSIIQVTEGEVTNDEQIETPVGLPRRTSSAEKTILEAARMTMVGLGNGVSLNKFAFNVTQCFQYTNLILFKGTLASPN